MKKYLFGLIAILLLTSCAFSQDMKVIDSYEATISETAQEFPLWFDTAPWNNDTFSGYEGWSLLYEIEGTIIGTTEIKYTELYPDLNEDDTVNEFDDDDWNTLETVRAIRVSTGDTWFHHALSLDACMGVMVYLDHVITSGTGTHTVYLIARKK